MKELCLKISVYNTKKPFSKFFFPWGWFGCGVRGGGEFSRIFSVIFSEYIDTSNINKITINFYVVMATQPCHIFDQFA